jgi:hypothetical protein
MDIKCQIDRANQFRECPDCCEQSGLGLDTHVLFDNVFIVSKGINLQILNDQG